MITQDILVLLMHCARFSCSEVKLYLINGQIGIALSTAILYTNVKCESTTATSIAANLGIQVQFQVTIIVRPHKLVRLERGLSLLQKKL